MSAVELCPAHRYDDDVVCLLDEDSHEAGTREQPWTLICRYCWTAMMDGRARRQDWKLEP